jgi:hypothetical protein
MNRLLQIEVVEEPSNHLINININFVKYYYYYFLLSSSYNDNKK